MWFYADWPSSKVGYTKRRKTKRKKENVFNQNSLGSASRRTSTERRKLEHFMFFLLVFFLSVEVLLETDPNDFKLGIFPYCLSFFFLCVIYPRRKSVLFLLSVDSLHEVEFWFRTFSFFLLVFFSMCNYPRGRSVHIKTEKKVYLSLFSLYESSPWGRSKEFSFETFYVFFS